VVLQHIILAAGWIVFCGLHSLLASTSVKQKLNKDFAPFFRRYRLYYTLFSVFSFGLVLWYQFNLSSPYIYIPFFLSSLLGTITGCAGLMIMAICIRKYFGRLSGLKTLFADEINSGNQLIISGIHRHVRHPLYAGTFLFIWGLFIFLPLTSLLISNFIITVYTLIGIRLEEEKLVKEFGESYRMYQKKVPKLIPTLKPSPTD
jgi:protein-S-isoprenylcysteine O-methyltransferase Ste14